MGIALISQPVLGVTGLGPSMSNVGLWNTCTCTSKSCVGDLIQIATPYFNQFLKGEKEQKGLAKSGPVKIPV